MFTKAFIEAIIRAFFGQIKEFFLELAKDSRTRKDNQQLGADKQREESEKLQDENVDKANQAADKVKEMTEEEKENEALK